MFDAFCVGQLCVGPECNEKAEACPSALRKTVYESLRFAATTKLRIGRNLNQVVAVRANNFVL